MSINTGKDYCIILLMGAVFGPFSAGSKGAKNENVGKWSFLGLCVVGGDKCIKAFLWSQ